MDLAVPEHDLLTICETSMSDEWEPWPPEEGDDTGLGLVVLILVAATLTMIGGAILVGTIL